MRFKVKSCCLISITLLLKGLFLYQAECAQQVYGKWYVSTSHNITNHVDNTTSGSLAWVVGQAAGSYVDVELPGNHEYVLRGDITIPEHIRLVRQAGAFFSAPHPVNLTISGDFVSGNDLAFGDNVTVHFTKVDRVDGRWWTNANDGTSDNTAAVNRARLSLPPNTSESHATPHGGGTIYLPGTWKFNLVIDDWNINVEGDNPTPQGSYPPYNGKMWVAADPGKDIIEVTRRPVIVDKWNPDINVGGSVTIKNAALFAREGISGQKGIRIHEAAYVRVENTVVRGFSLYGVKVGDANDCYYTTYVTFDMCDFDNTGSGGGNSMMAEWSDRGNATTGEPWCYPWLTATTLRRSVVYGSDNTTSNTWAMKHVNGWYIADNSWIECGKNSNNCIELGPSWAKVSFSDSVIENVVDTAAIYDSWSVLADVLKPEQRVQLVNTMVAGRYTTSGGKSTTFGFSANGSNLMATQPMLDTPIVRDCISFMGDDDNESKASDMTMCKAGNNLNITNTKGEINLIGAGGSTKYMEFIVPRDCIDPDNAARALVAARSHSYGAGKNLVRYREAAATGNDGNGTAYVSRGCWFSTIAPTDLTSTSLSLRVHSIPTGGNETGMTLWYMQGCVVDETNPTPGCILGNKFYSYKYFYPNHAPQWWEFVTQPVEAGTVTGLEAGKRLYLWFQNYYMSVTTGVSEVQVLYQ